MVRGFFKNGLPLAYLVLTLGVPTPLDRGSQTCHRPIEDISLTVRATGVESSGNWALVAMNGREDILVNEGDALGHCLSLSGVTNNSIVVRATTTGEERQFFFGGFSTAHVEQKRPTSNSRDGYMRAVEGHQITPVSSTIDKIEYPPFSNSNTLPQVVYRNEQGAALYDDFEAIGLGRDPQSQAPESGLAGVTIGDNSTNSIFGALGLTAGDRIVAINGHHVSSPEEIGRIMREAGDATIQIGYAEGESSGVITTAALIKKS